MSHPAIRVEGLGKKYRIDHKKEAYGTLRDMIVNTVRSPLERLQSLSGRSVEPNEEFWALQDVSFSVEPGDVLGVIGPNGAGKSTLLKILSRITKPTTGLADIFGRVGSLLEVGTGFHPELTGRENIYLNGAVLGMRRWEIKKNFDEIVDFSGVEQFLDTPVKRYSSGMYVRLAFSVAAHLEPEILLVDEVLAVGDAEFKRKCLGKIGGVASQGRTVIFVSHDMAALASICQKGMVLSKGKVTFKGTIHDAVGVHLRALRFGKGRVEYAESQGDRLQITAISVLDESGAASEIFSVSSRIQVVIEYTVYRVLTRVQILCHIWTAKKVHVMVTGDVDFSPHLLQRRPPGKYRAKITIPADVLAPGEYLLQVACGLPSLELIDDKDGPGFEITGAGSYAENWSTARRDVVVAVPLKWDVTSTHAIQETDETAR
ncbi:MAG: ABC transporter ATP-binding protein [Pseudomonadota bacterium]